MMPSNGARAATPWSLPFMPATADLRAVIAAESSGLRGWITDQDSLIDVFSLFSVCIDFSFPAIADSLTRPMEPGAQQRLRDRAALIACHCNRCSSPNLLKQTKGPGVRLAEEAEMVKNLVSLVMRTDIRKHRPQFCFGPESESADSYSHSHCPRR